MPMKKIPVRLTMDSIERSSKHRKYSQPNILTPKNDLQEQGPIKDFFKQTKLSEFTNRPSVEKLFFHGNGGLNCRREW